LTVQKLQSLLHILPSWSLSIIVNMPKSRKPPVCSVDQQMADIAAQIAALTARQDAAIREMERAAAEVAQKSKEHDRLVQVTQQAQGFI
jgi:hypothetical protein